MNVTKWGMILPCNSVVLVPYRGNFPRYQDVTGDVTNSVSVFRCEVLSLVTSVSLFRHKLSNFAPLQVFRTALISFTS